MWVIAGLLAVIAACLLLQLPQAGVKAYAQEDQPQAYEQVRPAAAAMFAVPAQITRDTYGVYLVDPQSRTICAYQWLAGEHKLKLVAARSFAFDVQLDDYNTEPLPRWVKGLVEKNRRLTATTAPAD